MPENNSLPKRETFSSLFGVVMTMIGVAVGLGAFWRFPYMAGRFGGSAFVLFYMLITLFIGIPALMAEWMLGKHTKRGTLGAFEKGGFPGGKWVGFFLFAIVIFATGYYSNVVGWVAFHGSRTAPQGLPRGARRGRHPSPWGGVQPDRVPPPASDDGGGHRELRRSSRQGPEKGN